MGFPYESGPYGILIFLALTIVMGGAAALSAGRALAATWRPVWLAGLYAAPISMAIAFLHYALFQEAVIPLYALASALASLAREPGASLLQIGAGLRGFAALFIIHACFALLGYRLTRVRQMNSQYRFAVLADGPFRWRSRT